jgi:hypothetical protein
MNEVEPRTAPRRQGFSRRWLVVTVLVLLPLLVLAGVYFYLGQLAERELRNALAEADRLDPGWRLDDLLGQRAEGSLGGKLGDSARK